MHYSSTTRVSRRNGSKAPGDGETAVARCGGDPGSALPDRGGGTKVALPVLPSGGRVKPSRMSRRRALVLIAVHLLIAVHIAHWYATGRTLSPLEPSEAMEFSKSGIVNAGAIFFALAILSTLVLGRFFCGWGCHVIALQDLCRWLLGKAGLRPRAMRSRLLIWVPLIAFFYMFVFPIVQRASAGRSVAHAEMHLTTTQFWATFPGWVIGGLTFLTCGFVIVYLLGSKGFCTYGCPYGGIFGVADRLAPGRIRVTDACEGCGHCTAACTSNVRVHEEVRDFGMVVDPGCMKCMDCVSVCPNDALYFGFGAPASFAQPRAKRKASPEARRDRSARRARFAVHAGVYAAAGYAAARVLFSEAFGAMPEPVWVGLACVMGVLSASMRGDYNLLEELLLGGYFLAAFAAFRGLYDVVPFLMALGVAAILAYLALQTTRMFTRTNVRLQQFSLRRGGRLTRAGTVFLAAMAPIALLWAHSGVMQRLDADADRAYRASFDYGVTMEQSLSGASRLSAEQRSAVEEGRTRGAALIRWGLTASAADLARQAWFAILLQDRADAEAHLERAVRVSPESAALRREYARFLLSVGKPDRAVTQLKAAADLDPTRETLMTVARLLAAAGRPDPAEAALHRAIELHGESPEMLHALAVLALTRNEPLEAVAQAQRAVTLDPDFGDGHHLLGEVFLALGRTDGAIPHLQRAAALLPQRAVVHRLLGQALLIADRAGEAEAPLRKAAELEPNQPSHWRVLAECYRVLERPEDMRACEARAAALESASTSPSP
ncbi:MAG: tetratricopeptide repeat protein [Phycisphaerae bacterium]|nr:MAG: tetratricopeptide repeat protein [Planctomycetota bacterium]MBE7457063.1 tetratricopeptide repeat protein [Planctomycetia bacterium]MCL4718247.1 tetratricopeptide repeat protein [Phycisphaerae bacterium]